MAGPCSSGVVVGSASKITNTTSPVSQTGSSAGHTNGHHGAGHHNNHHHHLQQQHGGNNGGHHNHFVQSAVATGSAGVAQREPSLGASCKAYCTGTEDEVLIVRHDPNGHTQGIAMDILGNGPYSNGTHSIGGAMYGSNAYVASSSGSGQVTTIL